MPHRRTPHAEIVNAFLAVGLAKFIPAPMPMARYPRRMKPAQPHPFVISAFAHRR
jgi:hypothetical protein